MPPPASSTPKFNPLETIALQSPTSPASSVVEFSPKVGPSVDPDAPVKRWYHYIPLCAAILLILAPHPSWLFVLISYHYTTLHRPLLGVTHLLVTYALTFMIYSSLIVCVARDPGPVTFVEDEASTSKDGADGGAEPLMPHEDYSLPGRWCRKCWGPKPERTHHCSICGRCVLKMDHHCPWMGAKCIGHRTYPAFLHFLLCVTLLATYIAVVCILAVWDAFTDPSIVNELTPLHALFLAFYALVFALVMGSFYFYHLRLVCTNQTTIENLSPFLILRHLPPLPPGHGHGQGLSDPPLEQELSRAQRSLVKEAQGWIRVYDVGWRRNAGQVFGWRGRWGWVGWVWCGGKGVGDGRVFPRNPKAEEMLQRLATEIVEVEERRR